MQERSSADRTLQVWPVVRLIAVLTVLAAHSGLGQTLYGPEVHNTWAFNGQPLTLSASATPSAGRAPLNVTFKGSFSGGTPPYAIFWDFGDGGSSIGLTETFHVYAFPGAFTAEFWVQDSATPSSKQVVRIPIKVHATGWLQVSVLDQGLEPISGATVRMVNGPEGQVLLEGGTGGRGQVDFGLVASGAYSLEVSAVGFKTNSTQIAVLPGGPTPAVIIMFRQETPSGLTYLIPYLAGAGSVITVALFLLNRRKHAAASLPKRLGSKGTSPREQLRILTRL